VPEPDGRGWDLEVLSVPFTIGSPFPVSGIIPAAVVLSCMVESRLGLGVLAER